MLRHSSRCYLEFLTKRNYLYFQPVRLQLRRYSSEYLWNKTLWRMSVYSIQALNSITSTQIESNYTDLCVKLEDIQTNTKQSYRQKKLKKFLLCYIGKWADGHSFAYQHDCKNMNVWRFFKLWTAKTLALTGGSIWNLQEPFKQALFTLCKNFVKTVVNLNFWSLHWKP